MSVLSADPFPLSAHFPNLLPPPLHCPFSAATRLVANAVRGLSYLHKRAGITHGDVKAANMMVDGSCSVLKLCDFGMAGREYFVVCLRFPFLRSLSFAPPFVVVVPCSRLLSPLRAWLRQTKIKPSREDEPPTTPPPVKPIRSAKHGTPVHM